MENNDNLFYGQTSPDQASQPDNQNAAEQQSNVNQSNQQNAYEQNTNQYGNTQNPYEQNTNQYGNTQNPYQQNTNPYNNSQSPYTQGTNPYAAYGQNGQQYQSYGMNQQPMDENGNTLKNRFGMKLTFSILEIISCNLITFILGIVSCVFTTKANNSYKSGDVQSFKSQAKTSAVCLWVGLASFILGWLMIVIVWNTGFGDAFMEGFNQGFYGTSGGSTSTLNPETSVSVCGTQISIPLNYSDMEALGFTLDSYDVTSEIEGNQVDFKQLIDGNGDYVMWAWFENTSSNTKDITDCVIIGIDVDYNCVGYEYYMTEAGVNFGSSREECISLLGTPDLEEDGKLYWYLDGEENSTWRVIEITFEDGMIYDIDVDYR